MMVANFNLLIRVSKICTQETTLIATNLHSEKENQNEMCNDVVGMDVQ